VKSDHIPIMVKECLEYFSGISLKVFFDATLGAGGHAKALLEAHPEIETYIGCDKDPDGLKIARENLSAWKEKVGFVQGNFADVDQILRKKGIKKVDGFFLT
jgi:16S rRNA (cytosine1402-N4)-methyltransferase